MDMVSTILMLSSIQGLLLAVVLFLVPKRKKRANRILAFLLALLCLAIMLHTVSHSSSRLNVPYHPEIIMILFFLFGPLVYFYVKNLVSEQTPLGKKEIIHFVPFLAIAAFYIPASLGAFISWAVLIHVLVYMLLALGFIVNGQRSKDPFSVKTGSYFLWSKMVVGVCLLAWAIALSLKINSSGPDARNLVWFTASMLILGIGYVGWIRPEIFMGTEAMSVRAYRKQKYEKSNLTKEKSRECLTALQRFMREKKPYLHSDISLYKLAADLSLSAHHLSQIINEELHLNFFEFINSYRVNEAKERLKDPNNDYLTIAAIGFDSGFNSISAFNAAFKKHAGVPPSHFRDRA